MAQLVAHLHGMERVRGSNPLSSTDKASEVIRKLFHIPCYMKTMKLQHSRLCRGHPKGIRECR